MRALLISLALTSFSCTPQRQQSVLRVCAAPDDLPFSDRLEHGFENRIARVLAAELGARLHYSWGNTTDCDVFIGAPANGELVTTRPYYRSSYVFLTRADRSLYLRSLDDARLCPLKVGVEERPHATLSQALLERGVDHVSRFPSARLITAVEKEEIDVGLVWGPVAGAFARGEQSSLRISVITPAFSRDVCVGVRAGKAELRDALDRALEQRRDEIDAILREYGVPLTSL